ncbi:MAG: glutathione transferase GstA [Deltaproteobacteria bacterium]
MKLYYAPGACSLSPHITLREAELPFELVKTDTKTKTIADGSDYWLINPKGYVPCLELDSGERLTEGPAIVQYIADQVPAKKLAPENGSLQRYHLQEWLNYVTAELHKGYGALFTSTTPEDYKPIARDRLTQRYELVDTTLAKQPYLLGSTFSVADPYLFVVTNWARHAGVNLDRFKALQAFQGRMRERPAVLAALKAEGLS